MFTQSAGLPQFSQVTLTERTIAFQGFTIKTWLFQNGYGQISRDIIRPCIWSNSIGCLPDNLCPDKQKRFEISQIIQIRTTEIDELVVRCEFTDFESISAAVINFQSRNFVQLFRWTVKANINVNASITFPFLV